MASLRHTRVPLLMLKPTSILRLLLVLTLAAWSALALSADGWLTTREGAKVWMQGIEPTDAATWSGGQDAEGYATGAGTMQRLAHGQLHSTTEGVMNRGRLEGQGTTRYGDGSMYEGHHVAGLRSGKGVMRWPNGRVYDGQWANGVFNGQGNMKMPDGRSYAGEYVNGAFHGRGVMRFPNGAVHDGEWANGAPHGKGVFNDAAGTVYEGDFLKGDRTGKAVYRFADGTRYEGEVLKGKYHGVGSLFSPDGRIYMQGTWDQNRFVKGWSDLE